MYGIRRNIYLKLMVACICPIILFLFVCCLFNDVVSRWGYMASNGRW